MQKNSKSGLTLMELLMGTAILIILMALMKTQLGALVQRTKVSSAKVGLNSLVLALNVIKTDTGLYPTQLSDIKQATAPDGFSNRNWYGPYGETISLTDPWGNPYFYEVTEGVIFGPEPYQKHTPTETDTAVFSTSPDEGEMIVENLGVTAGWIKLNGEEIISSKDFGGVSKKTLYMKSSTKEKSSGMSGGSTSNRPDPQPEPKSRPEPEPEPTPNPKPKPKPVPEPVVPIVQTITKTVNLLSENTLEVRITGGTSGKISLQITSSLSTESRFNLRSYGRDGMPGGTGWDADILYGEF